MASPQKIDHKSMSSLAEINVVPLVDVVLVLLIIFMVTAPLLISGIDVSLPETAQKMDSEDEPLVITITRDERVYINEEPRNVQLLKDDLKRWREMLGNRPVEIRADEAVPYGFVITILDQVKTSGFEIVGLASEPLPPEGT